MNLQQFPTSSTLNFVKIYFLYMVENYFDNYNVTNLYD